MKLDKLKISLLLCSEKRCEECHYNRYVREVCQTHLYRDTIKSINELERKTEPEMIQLSIDI